MSKEILTIREAVWLTDNTYKYEDVVRMMGEIVSVLGGKIRVSSIKVPGAGFIESQMFINFLSPPPPQPPSPPPPPPPTQSPTLLDYGEVLLSLLPLERRTAHLFGYICELSLLNSGLARLPLSKLACAALMLTRALHRYGNKACGAGRRAVLN